MYCSICFDFSVSCRILKIEYLDLYLIHMPFSSKPKPGNFPFPVEKEDIVPMDMKSVWEAMEECQKIGLTRAIGVSNFTEKKLELLLSTAKIPPQVNQVSLMVGCRVCLSWESFLQNSKISRIYFLDISVITFCFDGFCGH